MKKTLLAALGTALLFSGLSSSYAEDMNRDPRDMHCNRMELKRDIAARRHLHRAIARERREGDVAGVARDRQELARLNADIRRDRREMHRDCAERRRDGFARGQG